MQIFLIYLERVHTGDYVFIHIFRFFFSNVNNIRLTITLFKVENFIVRSETEGRKKKHNQRKMNERTQIDRAEKWILDPGNA